MSRPACIIESCDRPSHAQGRCNTHYCVPLRRGELGLMPPRSDRERFEAMVDRSAGPDGCHLWTGSQTTTGYGQFNGGQGTKAHRYAYRWENGPVARGEVIRHSCDTPLCVNARHLLKGSQRDNVRDAIDRGRHVYLPVETVRGVRNVNAKLNPELVREMRAAHALGATTRELAARYGLSQSSTAAVIRRATWSHVA